MNQVQVNDPELHTILAALRYYQAGDQGDPDNRTPAIDEIATNDGTCTALDTVAINHLCERLNCGGKSVASMKLKPDSGLFEMIRRIDWRLLAEQKAWLLTKPPNIAEARGLVELLDALQDAAVAELGIPEDQVFAM